LGTNFFSFWYSKLTAVGDNDGSAGLTRLGTIRLDSLENFLTVSHVTEDDVLTIEMRESIEAEEELGTVSVGTSVGHGEDTGASVLVVEVLVSELGTIDGLTTGTVAAGEVTTLSHEARDDTMELASLEVEGLARLTSTLLTSAESSKVLGGVGSIFVELDGDTTSILVVDGNVEEDSRVGFNLLLSCGFHL